MTEQWSYLKVDLVEDEPIEQLNAFGQLSWELVSVTTVSGKQRAYFKRPLLLSMALDRSRHSSR